MRGGGGGGGGGWGWGELTQEREILFPHVDMNCFPTIKKKGWGIEHLEAYIVSLYYYPVLRGNTACNQRSNMDEREKGQEGGSRSTCCKNEQTTLDRQYREVR